MSDADWNVFIKMEQSWEEVKEDEYTEENIYNIIHTNAGEEDTLKQAIRLLKQKNII